MHNPRLGMSAAAAVLLCLPAAHAAGGVFKCTTENRGVIYQDTPCTPGNELRNLDKDPPTLSVVPGLPTANTHSAPPATVRSSRIAPSDRAASSKEKNQLEKAGERRFIRVGMTEAEVLTRIGRPEINGHKKDTRSSGSMEWSYLPNAGDPGTITTVTIVGGKVTDVQRKVSR
jgi:Domain of unknown function (DUF4124)